MYKYFIFIFVYFILYNIAFAGPFGTNMNDKIEQYNNLKQIAHNQYLTNFLPNSHEKFTPYMLEFNTNGLHSVTGLGKLHEYDHKCFRVLSEFLELKKLLTKKYGEPTTIINEINPEGHFPIGMLSSSDPKLFALWDNNLPDNLSRIIIVGTAEDMAEGETRCSIKYEYNNYVNKKEDSL